ncbi:MAG: hypothetical protein PHG44_03700 [Lentisphaeria bacterium]|jgi:hypothetical protein|nr:hypothetical protein [Lentisphaeria bacterium]MDY0175277.1 hypothetical protein [Lentisphaeria bacterium]NLZ59627.1 hypothetical protein [Lentisphaerota bacterium]
MTNTSVKTLQEHRQYLHEIVKLKLCFLHQWLQKHPEESFSEALRNRIDVYRKTDCNKAALNPKEINWEAEDWQCLEKKAEEIYSRCQNDPEKFESLAFAVFKDSLDARCERDYHDRSARNGYQCGCLRHNLKLNENSTTPTLGFHIANFLSPESFFDYPGYIRDSFNRLLDAAEKQFQAKYISTSTWLNSLPKWLELFPHEWQENLGPENTDIKWHYGFWGQFITAKQTFNHKFGEILRNSGKLPYYPRASFCSVKSMREQIRKL